MDTTTKPFSRQSAKDARARRFRSLTLDGTTYRLRSLNAREYQQSVKRAASDDKDRFAADMHVSLVAMCLVDDAGQPHYSDAERNQDWRELEDWDCGVFNPLLVACNDLCGLGRQSGDILKNSTTTPDSDST